jgi:hypothetical protein
VLARILYDIAFKTSPSIDWRTNIEQLYNDREATLKGSYVNSLRILKTDVLHEALVEMQSPPISKEDCPLRYANRPCFPSNYYGLLQINTLHMSQRGAVDEAECAQGWSAADLQMQLQ